MLLAAFAGAPVGYAQGQPLRTVVLVRHAERDGGMGDEVGISQAGRCRADGLARMLADAGIRAIYTSESARTQQTAAPLAKKLGIQPEVVPAKDIAGLVKRLRSAPEHAAILVVGHSNTVPEIIERLGAGSAADRRCQL
jgi:phosphohistidine phosphatase SixA